jgi:anti-sigma B factor antagonist
MSALDLSITTAELGENAFVVTLAGEADLYTAPELERALEGVIALGATAVVLDLADVTFVDSTTLGILLRYNARFGSLGGDLVIVTDDRRVLRTFEITGLDKMFRIQDRLAEAVESVLGDTSRLSASSS